MCADPERTFLGEEIGLDEINDPPLQWAENGPPVVRAVVVPAVQFRCEAQEPPPAVRFLERFVVVEVLDLSFDVLGGKSGVHARFDLGFSGVVVEQAKPAEQTPMAMNRGVPVETAVKDRVLLARSVDVPFRIHRPGEMRELRFDTIKRVFGEPFYQVGTDPVASA